jgi:hypothetical protein
MSTRKAQEPSAPPVATAPPVRKKHRAPRVRLTHLEIRRGETLRLRIAIADDAMAEAGDELGALIKKISPSTKTSIVTEPDPVPPPDFVVSRSHMDNADAYHATLRTHLADLFSSLCDTSLADALEIAREESARRSDGMN